MLRQTLADRRVTGSEKRALTDVLRDHDVDTQQLAYLRHRAFAVARDAVVDSDSQDVLRWLEDVIKLLIPNADDSSQPHAEACFSPSDDCPLRICSLFDRAKRTADVCVFTITDDRIASSMMRAHQRGVTIRVISDDDKAEDLGSDIYRLKRAGLKVRMDRSQYHMHHKFAIFDGELLLTGSYNWTRGAAEKNEENFIITGDRRLVGIFTRVFERLWNDLS